MGKGTGLGRRKPVFSEMEKRKVEHVLIFLRPPGLGLQGPKVIPDEVNIYDTRLGRGISGVRTEHGRR